MASGGPPSDEILLQGLTFHGYHGYHASERVLGQKFVLDVVLQCDLRQAGRSGVLADSIDYTNIYKEIEKIFCPPAEPCILLEEVCEKISSRLFSLYSNLIGLSLSLLKPHVAVPGVVGGLGIKIFRQRKEYQTDNNTEKESKQNKGEE